MKKLTFIAVAVFIALSLPAIAEQQAAGDSAKLAAAKACLKANSAEKMFDQMMAQVKKMVAQRPGTPVPDADAIKATLNFEEMNKTMLDGLIKNFSLEELKAMAKFFNSPVGQAIMKKMPVYQSEVMPAVMQKMQQAVGVYMQAHMAHPGSEPSAPSVSAPETAPAASAPAAAPDASTPTPAPAPSQH